MIKSFTLKTHSSIKVLFLDLKCEEYARNERSVKTCKQNETVKCPQQKRYCNPNISGHKLLDVVDDVAYAKNNDRL